MLIGYYQRSSLNYVLGFEGNFKSAQNSNSEHRKHCKIGT